MKEISASFDFLVTHDAQLARLGGLAERYFRDDPNTCFIKLRQFGEVLAQLTAANSDLLASPEEQQADLLLRLKFERKVPREVSDLFHQLRIAGNRATHRHSDDHAEALNIGVRGTFNSANNENLAKSTSGVNNINSEQLKTRSLPLPPLLEQCEIIGRVKSAFARVDQAGVETTRATDLLERLDQAFLAKAFRGELVKSQRRVETEMVVSK